MEHGRLDGREAEPAREIRAERARLAGTVDLIRRRPARA
jgi:hypothetical protein